ncbi:protein tamozhennic [Tribolium castaneum]|nr:PREDICTED: protein tamozhennic [Tribolium castaneum]|eukprot:XP_001809413.1 PREDICTED: protein tamozhennic [Tribolium castaneum]
MVIMDVHYSTDRLREVWQAVDQLHLSYLEMEESPEKLDHRIRLEDCIREYLCMALHSQKFVLRETGEVLYRSASTKRDFSGYKAATGWNAIQIYAGNLLSQPWRKEYRQIKTYCGFYKHQIEANLVGAEIMFEVMGYRNLSNGVMVLEGPICPDTVTNVSKDCLIAYVECQILKHIWEEISPTFKITWLEVLEFRKAHLCTPEHSIRALTYQFYEKQFQAQNSDYSRCHQTPVAPAVQYPPQITPHNHVPVTPMPYVYAPTCCPNNYATYAHVPYSVPLQYPPHVVKPSFSNGYYCANGYINQQPPSYEYGVPTGQLIELDSHHNGGYDAVDRPTNSLRVHRNSLSNHEKKVNEAKTVNSKELEKPESHFEDWDYVYRNLESQGYSKDLGERGDILGQSAEHKKSKCTNLDEAMHNLTITERPLKISEALEKYDGEPEPIRKNVRKHSQSSSYENLSEIKKANVAKPAKTKTPTVRDKPVNNNNYEAKNTNCKWECKACTYHNETSKDICEMCSKSRSNVEQQMEIGGPQCSKCTLVNLKEAKVCQACGASLKDSPTYI